MGDTTIGIRATASYTETSGLEQDSRRSLGERTPLISSSNVSTRHTCLEQFFLALFFILIVIVGCSGVYLLFTEDEAWYVEKFPFISRKVWNASTPTESLKKFENFPISAIRLVQTNTTECVDEFQCKQSVRGLQDYAVTALKQPDIPYNFLIDRDGKVYEGRGWIYRSFYQDRDYDTLMIAFLGNYNVVAPSERQISSLKAFLDYSVMKNVLRPCYVILAEYTKRRFFVDIAFKLEEQTRVEYKCDFYL